jgi:hypothetical protein
MRFLLPLVLVAAAFAEDPAADMPALIEKIRKGSPAECVDAVAKVGKEERAAEPIAIRMRDEPDAQTKAVLKEALTAHKPFVIVKAMKNALAPKAITDEFKREALEILVACKEEGAVNLVTTIAFESEMQAMRAEGQKALATFEDLAVKATDRYVRVPARAKEAIAVLQAIGTETAAKALVHYLVTGSSKETMKMVGVDSETRDAVITAVLALGDKSAPALIGGLDSFNHQKWCSYCLQKISGEFHTMKEKAKWLDWWKRRQAVLEGR